jgi:streptomycin 6-kinase
VPVEIPPAFRELVAGRPAWRGWFDSVPRLLADLLLEWQLTPDGRSRSGECAVVVPVRTADGRRAVLKVGWPHEEADFEHLALRAWAGNGAVELWRADPRRYALLLERADADVDLTSLPVIEACEVVAGLYRTLHRPALPQPRRLSELCVQWADRMPALAATQLAPRRFVEQATSLLRSFGQDPATDGRLLHSDLHFGNVLGSHRQPWLVIDPKPLSGDPAYEVAPLLWNRWPEVLATGSVRGAVLDRLYAVVDAAGLDEDRVRDWVVVREMVNVLWSYEDARDRGEEVDRDWITRATTIVKAVQR